jgi:hypothetical protein
MAKRSLACSNPWSDGVTLVMAQCEREGNRMAPWLDGLILIVALGLVGRSVDFRARRKRRGLDWLAGPRRAAGTDPVGDVERIGPGTVINADGMRFRDPGTRT